MKFDAAEPTDATMFARHAVLFTSRPPEAVIWPPAETTAVKSAVIAFACAWMTRRSAGKFALRVEARTANCASAPAFTEARTTTLGGVQVAFACALALQFAWQFASTWHPPLSVPPLHEIGVPFVLQPAEHVTVAWPAGGEHVASHLPLQLPEQVTPGAVTLHVPLQVPLQLPLESVATLH